MRSGSRQSLCPDETRWAGWILVRVSLPRSSSPNCGRPGSEGLRAGGGKHLRDSALSAQASSKYTYDVCQYILIPKELARPGSGRPCASPRRSWRDCGLLEGSRQLKPPQIARKCADLDIDPS